jgi:hypothetical protein
MIIALILSFSITGCSPKDSNNRQHTASSASWEYVNMVVINGKRYLGTNEKVNKVGKKLGVIKTSSTKEIDFNPENFSNTYPKGTNLYEIKGIDSSKAIALEIEKNKFIKAIRKEE